MKIKIPVFKNTMTKAQMVLGFIYFPLHFLVFPIFLGGLLLLFVPDINLLQVNIAYYVLGIIFVFTVMFKLLKQHFHVMLECFQNSIFAFLNGYILNVVLGLVVTTFLYTILGNELLNPNNASIEGMANVSSMKMMAIAVILAPIIEEVLFRGLIFGSLREKHRVLAYVLSTFLFSFFHVWQYALMDFDATILIYFVQYIPASVALARAYERSSSLWVPIFLHMLINYLAMSLI